MLPGFAGSLAPASLSSAGCRRFQPTRSNDINRLSVVQHPTKDANNVQQAIRLALAAGLKFGAISRAVGVEELLAT